MSNPKQPLNFKVKDNEYPIKTPNVGQLWDIEEMKAVLSNGQYGAVLASNTVWSVYNLDNIDMFAHLTVLCPGLITDMKVKSWKELDPFDLEELRKAYKEQFNPWFDAFTKMLRAVQNPTPADGKQSDSTQQ